MPNVFISHSSIDKPFVLRLGHALLAQGFPVWLDHWTIDLGDSLIDQVYDGIEGSSVVLLVVSRNAVNSGWVNRELNAALAKEGQTNRRFVIPILIDGCELPLKVADRLYADFSSERFTEPLSKLVSALATKGCRNLPVAPERELLGVSFTREVHLDKVSLQRAWDHLRRRHNNFTLLPTQVIIASDSGYDRLLQKLQANIDNIGSHPDYSPDFEQSLKYALESICLMEEWLRSGIAMLLSHARSMEAVFWFAKILRGRIVSDLHAHQLRSDLEVLDYGRSWYSAHLLSNSDAATFFETESVIPVDMWNRKRRGSEYFHFWLGEEESDFYVAGTYAGPGLYYQTCRGSKEDKYVFPQMLLQHLRFPERTGEPIWDLQEAIIGIH